jgi:hypothetical protein
MAEGDSSGVTLLEAVSPGEPRIIFLGPRRSGKSSIVEEFAEYLSKHRPQDFKLVTEVRHVNLPALSGGELIQMAHKWKKVQMEFGA